MSSLEQNLPWPAQKKGDLILPMLSWAPGLLILFLAVAWVRVLRRSRS